MAEMEAGASQDQGEDFGQLFQGKGESFAKFASFFYSSKTALINSRENFSVLKTLSEMKEKVLEILDKKGVNDAIDYIKEKCKNKMKPMKEKKNNGGTETIYEKVWNDVKNETEKDKITTILEKYRTQQANDMVHELSKASLSISVVQFVKIINAWDKISKASNYVRDEEKFHLIENEIARMNVMLEEIISMFEENPNDQRIDRKITILNIKFTGTSNLIGREKVKIDGHIREVCSVKDSSLMDGATCVVNAIDQFYQLFNTWELLTDSTKLLGAFSSIFSFGVCLFHARNYKVSVDTLKELDRDLTKINRLYNEVNLIHSQVIDLLN